MQRQRETRWRRRTVDAHDGNGRYGVAQTEGSGGAGSGWPFNLGYWYRLDHQSKAIAVRMSVAEQKNRELADVKAQFLERQTQANNYKRRVDVIDGLRQNQTGPVNLLAMLGETVNNTEAVWLSKMDDSAPQRESGRHGAERPMRSPT
jgi:Holliday junction resolvase-like predicted endonuclease